MDCRTATLIACTTFTAAAQLSFTYEQLVDRLINLEALAALPPAGEKAGLASSYDRASRYDTATGRYIDWSANSDGDGYIRREGSGYVLAEMAGPGCITRIWSATAEAGHVRVYLDGAVTPAIDLPFRSYFSATSAPFDFPDLVYETSARGYNNYVPIPYQSSCRVVADSGWGRYFQFTYVTFAAGTTVPTFALPLPAPARAALAAVNRFFADSLGRDPGAGRAGEQRTTQTVTLGPGQSADVLTRTGSGVITALKVSVPGLASRSEEHRALRALALSAYWDGDASPALWAPLGDFFGSSIGVNPYATLPLGMSPDTFYSYWYMPYGDGAVVRVANDDTVSRTVSFAITTAPLARPAGELGRFHAKFHLDTLRSAAQGREVDWTMLRTTGRGRFVGVALHVYNYFGGWWGEGDEKFFADGEMFPSSFGTGSEDYLGYAWSSDQLFNQALHAQTLNEFGGNEGNISVCRYHTADNAPFSTSFEGIIEKYSDNESCPYAAVAYWYLAPGGTDPYPPLPVAARTGYYRPPPAVEGAIEGENMTVVRASGGSADDQVMTHFGDQWSNGAQIFWRDQDVGDSLVLQFDVAQAGAYTLLAQFTTAGDYGIVRTGVDGTTVGSPVDLYHSGVSATGQLTLGVVTLAGGQHRLSLVVTGRNPSSTNYFAGLDYILLQPVGTPVTARTVRPPQGTVVRFGRYALSVPLTGLVRAELLTVAGRRVAELHVGADNRLSPRADRSGPLAQGAYLLLLHARTRAVAVPVTVE